MTDAVPRKAGPSTGVSVALLIIGVVVAIVGVVLGIRPFVRTFTQPSFPTPGAVQLHLSDGTYVLYERTGQSSFNLDESIVTITPDMVTVTSPSGESVLIESPDLASERITRNDDVYQGAVRFKIDESGDYDVRVDTNESGRVIVARSLVDTFRKSLPGWGLAILGGGVAIAGTVMWIVGASRRRRQRVAYAVGPGFAPPGWYADPQGSGRLRYWDGNTWTDYFH